LADGTVGTFTSPGFDGARNYTNSSVCIWSYSAVDLGLLASGDAMMTVAMPYTIRLRVNAFDLEHPTATGYCAYDALEIKLGIVFPNFIKYSNYRVEGSLLKTVKDNEKG
jgi:hypothetical protein